MGTPIPERIARHCADAVDDHADRLVELAGSLHAEPELAFAEHRSAEKISGLLEREGFAVERGTAGLDTAFVARAGSGPLTVAFCAEYDALPGIGHACGHNLIAASSVGAGLALRDVADELGLTVLVVGTPAEEEGGGKIVMLDAGVFDDVALAMMAHPAPIDVAAPRPLALAEWEIRYRGTPSHSAMAPHLGVNAADALTVAEVAIGVGRQHLEPEQLVHGIVTHGGDAPNVVPADTRAVYDMRAPDVGSLERLQARVRRCIEAGAVATGCSFEITAAPDYAELRHDPWLSATYRDAILELGRTLLPPEQERVLPAGSTDMGNVSLVVPSIHPAIGVESGGAVNHQPEFTAACVGPSADRAVGDAAVAMARTTAAAAVSDEQRERFLTRTR
ncbi:M20 family metallopeptidase [Pseudonocardia endophytica]|uniref:Peptidase M20 domain-containing protein 2 n=1 Tax=Pseudonocardia endophytica TaxID=401976 RepID=A0A4R1HLY4_PSEEN|nr:M20 family metallopeptidase [Pseudonocardia endophytica]TCK20649.1 amidohydrolase [Pseudonocardia endophytica]